MEKSEAYQLFLLNAEASEEDIRQATDEKLFQFKNDVLQKYFVPTLLQKKLLMIQDLMLAEHVIGLGTQDKSEFSVAQWTGQPESRIHFLEQYETTISSLKLSLMNCSSFQQLHMVIQAFVLVQEYYMVLFRMLFNEFSEALPEEVNTREMIDTGKLLLSLKNGEIDNKMTWEIEREIARIDKIRSIKLTH